MNVRYISQSLKKQLCPINANGLSWTGESCLEFKIDPIRIYQRHLIDQITILQRKSDKVRVGKYHKRRFDSNMVTASTIFVNKYRSFAVVMVIF